MEILKKLRISSQNVVRKKPSNQKNGDHYLFSNEYKKKLPYFSAVLKNSFIPPCERLFNGFTLNLLQFNTGIKRKALLRSYLKSFLFLIRVRKITRFKNI